MDQQMIDALAAQITRERLNQAEYEAAAIRLENAGWNGCAAYMRREADAEAEHARRFAAYLKARRAVFGLQPLPAPEPLSLLSPADAFDRALELEQTTTAAIAALYQMAERAGDCQTAQALLWFIAEQTASEDEAADRVQEFEHAGANEAALLALDFRLGEVD